MALKPQAVELHIEELVLHGFARGDRLSIGDAVERELSRLIAEGGLAGSSWEAEHVNAGGFKVAPNAKPRTIGTEIAGNIYRGIANPGGKRAK
jgi:hypothetical protein